jgi:hypothetical protein
VNDETNIAGLNSGHRILQRRTDLACRISQNKSRTVLVEIAEVVFGEGAVKSSPIVENPCLIDQTRDFVARSVRDSARLIPRKRYIQSVRARQLRTDTHHSPRGVRAFQFCDRSHVHIQIP